MARLASASEIPPWPLNVDIVRCVGASLKEGGYRSAALYFSAAIQYQLRDLGETVSPLVRHSIWDTVRLIARGLGPGALKDAFPLQALDVIPNSPTEQPFDMEDPGHFKDVMILGSFFMLREIELSAAKAQYLSLDGNQVALTIPVHKTDVQGSLEYRSLVCACHAQALSLCPWHAAARHSLRLDVA